MSCCSVNGANKFFSKHARRYARRFRKRGLDAAQRRLVEGLKVTGIRGRSILEIGCGVGGLHLSLLKEGAASAVGIEVAGGMLLQARELSQELGMEERTQYLAGDFAEMNWSRPPAEMVLLDKVVCCYPDPERLLTASIAATADVYAISYPRDGWIARIAFQTSSLVGDLLRWSFHPYYHQPDRIVQTIETEGFAEVYSSTTIIWQVKVFRRVSTGGTMKGPAGLATDDLVG